MVERFNKPTVQGVITSQEQTYLLNPGNNGILVNRLTTVAHIRPVIATNPPVSQPASRSVRVKTGNK